jgi:biotin transport system substrate-specific component
MASNLAGRATSTVPYPPLIERLVPVRSAGIRVTLQLVLGAALLGALAQARIEIGAVPVTGQTLAVLLIGAAYGARLAGITVLGYLLAGGMGLALFSGAGAGWSTFAGTTGGYLIGFLPAALLVGYLAQRGWDRSYGLMAAAMVLGNLVIYLFGLLWLSRFAPDLATTLQWGLWPFLAGDLVKLLVAVALLPTAWRLLGRS